MGHVVVDGHVFSTEAADRGMGRYVDQAISLIPENEIQASIDGGYPTALVIVAQPYRDQIVRYLEAAGYSVDTKRGTDARLTRETGLAILKDDPVSNLGWRIVLGSDKPAFLNDALKQTADNRTPLAAVIPEDYRSTVLAQVESFETQDEQPATTAEAPEELRPTIKVTSFEGAKGLSAQHVYIAGLHNGELPHDPTGIKDLEICKFIVGLTRTRKKCTLLHTRNFAGGWKDPSSFLKWIDSSRLVKVTVNAAYWTQQEKAEAGK